MNWLAHDQTTALLVAVNFKETICWKFLIDHGADVNQADHMDETPLHRGIWLYMVMLNLKNLGSGTHLMTDYC